MYKSITSAIAWMIEPNNEFLSIFWCLSLTDFFDLSKVEDPIAALLNDVDAVWTVIGRLQSYLQTILASQAGNTTSPVQFQTISHGYVKSFIGLAFGTMVFQVCWVVFFREKAGGFKLQSATNLYNNRHTLSHVVTECLCSQFILNFVVWLSIRTLWGWLKV